MPVLLSGGFFDFGGGFFRCGFDGLCAFIGGLSQVTHHVFEVLSHLVGRGFGFGCGCGFLFGARSASGEGKYGEEGERFLHLASLA